MAAQSDHITQGVQEAKTPKQLKVVVMGAGPAGLTAAYELSKYNVDTVVLEKDDVVGGLSRTVSYKGYHFDIGGHRFFTKVQAVADMWHDVLKDDFLLRDRASRILYNKKLFHYPLRPINALLGLGIGTGVLVLLSYAYARLFPTKNEMTFEQWICNRFGKRLYKIFFKTYTEKVWGIPCSEISAEWAAQRIKGLSLSSALKNALIGARVRSKSDVIPTLIDSFRYPKLGPGMMWEKVADTVQEQGNQLRTGDVTKILWSGHEVEAVEVNMDGSTHTVEGTHFISSIPIRELIHKLAPAPPSEVLQAATQLKYRDFITVALIVNRDDLFPDNWIYIHDPSVRVGRVQNFKNWSPHMVPDPNKTCIGLEYFCFENDGIWTMPDEQLIALARNEVQALGLVQESDVEDGTVVRMPKAYPVYDDSYAASLMAIRRFLERIGNIQLIGRNGMHKYNNQDHSMLTAMLAADNILGADNDLWAVNAEQDYHEEQARGEARHRGEVAKLAATQPKVPSAIHSATQADDVLRKAFARIDKPSFAGACGIVSGLYVFFATLWLVQKGGPNVGAHLQLLGQYFMGYTVTYTGAVIGFLYGLLWGFLFGWLFAYLRNCTVGIYVQFILRKGEAESVRKLLDYI